MNNKGIANWLFTFYGIFVLVLGGLMIGISNNELTQDVLTGFATLTSTTQNVVAIPMGSPWKYLDDGSNQGTAWRQINFDDTNWKSGYSELGYGDGDEKTLVSYGPDKRNKYITTYFRKSLDVVDASKISSASIAIKRDDGAVVYINGVEIFRTNMPTGTISHTTLASSNSDTTRTYTIPASVFVTGKNVVAVEVHQRSKSSSDISFNLQLSADIIVPTCDGPTTQECSILNGIGSQSRTCSSGVWSTWSTCTVTSCNIGYTLTNGQCAQNTCTSNPLDTTCSGKLCSSVQTDNCGKSVSCTTSTTCAQCITNSDCNDNDANTVDTCSGTPARCTYEPCSDFSSRECSVNNGIGTQYRTCSSGVWSTWSTCTATSCNIGYTLTNGQCIQSTTNTGNTGFVSIGGNSQTINGEIYSVQSNQTNYSIQKSSDGTIYRFEVREGEARISGSDVDTSTGKQGADRSELSGQTKFPIKTTIWTSYSFMVEPGEPLPGSANVLGQFHAGTGSPTLSFRLPTDNNLQVVLRVGSSNSYTENIPYSKTDFVRGRWYNVVIQSKFSPYPSDGTILKIWIDGVQVVDLSNVVLGYTDSTSNYWKFGIYRSTSIPQTEVVQYANMELGTTDLSSRITNPKPISSNTQTTPTSGATFTTLWTGDLGSNGKYLTTNDWWPIQYEWNYYTTNGKIGNNGGPYSGTGPYELIGSNVFTRSMDSKSVYYYHDGGSVDRTELHTARNYLGVKEGSVVYMGWSDYYTILPIHTYTTFQWRDQDIKPDGSGGYTGCPVIQFEMIDNYYGHYNSTGGASVKGIVVKIKEGVVSGGKGTIIENMKAGQWYDYVVAIRYAKDNTGYFKVWAGNAGTLDYNKPPVYSYNGPTMYSLSDIGTSTEPCDHNNQAPGMDYFNSPQLRMGGSYQWGTKAPFESYKGPLRINVGETGQTAFNKVVPRGTPSSTSVTTCSGSSSQSCSVGVGSCARTGTQSRTCSNGVWSGWSTCSATAGSPTAEICGDGIDQDCNGSDLTCTTTGTTDEFYFNQDFEGVTLSGTGSTRKFSTNYDIYGKTNYLKEIPYLWEYAYPYTDIYMKDNCDSGRRCLFLGTYDNKPNNTGATTRTQMSLSFKPPTATQPALGMYRFSQRMYFSPDMANLKDFNRTLSGDYWITIWETWLNKSGNSSWSQNPAGAGRVSMGITKDSPIGSPLYWKLTADRVEAPSGQQWSYVWPAQTNKNVPIPFGQWFTLDVTIVDGYDKDGWVYVTITPDGGQKQVVFDWHNSTLYVTKEGTKYPEFYRHSVQPLKFYFGDPVLDWMSARGYKNYVMYNDFKWYKNAPNVAGSTTTGTLTCSGSSSQSCSVGVGSCARTGTQSRTCSNGVWSGWSTCSATAGSPTTEICGDGIDQDCNGSDLTCTTTSTGTTTKFAIIGDFGMDNTAEGKVATLVKGWNPEFIVTTGDNNYPNGTAATIDKNIGKYYQEYIYPYTGSYGSGSPTLTNRFFPSLGNHDYYTTGAVPYLDYFTLPTASSGNERYYDFVKGSVHFFIVNSNTQEADGTSSTSAQATWLKNRLATSTSPWKVVIFHHAAYSSDTDHGSTTRMQWPFKDWGANIILSGHAHTYERVDINGLTYIVNGLGGAGKYGFKSTPVVGSQIRYNTDWGAQLVEATDTTITLKFYNTAGTLIDTYTMSKSGASTAVCSGSNTQSCTITNGAGTQSGTCVSGSWSWDTCKVTNCNPGYVISGNSCISSNSVTNTIIAKGSSWRYLDDGSNQVISWTSSNFYDATWKTGNAELGYGDGDEVTLISYGPSSSTKYITTYFRKTFDITDASKVNTLTLGLKIDDGAVVYLNGAELYRLNMPTGTIAYSTLSTGAYNDGNSWQNFVVPKDSLITGTNTLAVEVHQNAASSSDLSFNLELNVTTS